MRHLAEAKMLQKAGLCSWLLLLLHACCVNTKVLLCIRAKFTWLQRSGPAGLHRGVNANLIWVFGCCSCWSTAEEYSLSLTPPSLFLHGNEKNEHNQCVWRRIKRLHLVSSSDSFISKPRARQEVPLRGVLNSDLLYRLFCLNKRVCLCYCKAYIWIQLKWICRIAFPNAESVSPATSGSFTCAENV